MKFLILKGSELKRIVVTFVCMVIVANIGISTSQAGSSQSAKACSIINGWPVDYASVWPTAIRKHNEAPSKVSATGYMKGYIEVQKKLLRISEKSAVSLVNSYEKYWTILESELIVNTGKVSKNSPSVNFLVPLLKTCSKYQTN